MQQMNLPIMHLLFWQQEKEKSLTIHTGYDEFDSFDGLGRINWWVTNTGSKNEKILSKSLCWLNVFKDCIQTAKKTWIKTHVELSTQTTNIGPK